MKKRILEVENLLFHKPIIEKIFSFINSTQDYFSFRSVCKQTFLVSRAPAIEERFRGYFRDLKRVRKNGYALECVCEAMQTPEICMAAVQQDGYAFKYVKEQTPEICMAGVQQNGYALKFIKEQTSELCMAAFQQTRWALQFVAPRFRHLFK